jgi:hypothetical protein
MFMLRENLHFCIANERPVFLDLDANRYFCLPTATADVFKNAAASAFQKIAGQDAEQLAELGILAQAPDDTALHRRETVEPAVIGIDSRPGWSDLFATLDGMFCRRAARRRTETMTLSAIAHKLQGWKATPSKPQRSLDAKMRADIAAFAKSRHFHVSQDQCLSSSFALLQFLRKRQFFPNLVIGVKMSPFAAHAWVQHGRVVLADEVDKVRLYTPILVV